MERIRTQQQILAEASLQLIKKIGYPAVVLLLILGIIIVGLGPGLNQSFLVKVIVVLLVPIVYYHPKWGIYLLTFATFFLDWFATDLNILPHSATWLIEVILLILLLKVVLLKLKTKDIKGANFDKILLALIVIGTVSAVGNGCSPFKILLGMRVYFKYILMFYILINLELDEKFLKRIIIVVLALIALQVVIVISQYSLGTQLGDAIFGSTRSVGTLTTLSLITICMLCALYIQYRPRIVYLIISLLLFVPAILGEAKAFFLYLPITVVFLFRKVIFKSLIRSALIIFLLSIFLFASLKLFGKFHRISAGKPKNLSVVFSSPARLTVDDTYAPSITPRIQSMLYAHAQIERDTFNWLFGFGIGSRTFTDSERQKIPFLILSTALVSQMLVELGYIGIILFFLIFYFVYRMNSRFYWKIEYSFWRAISFGFRGAIFVYVLSNTYTDITHDLLGFTFWFLASSIYSVAALRKREGVYNVYNGRGSRHENHLRTKNKIRC